MIIQEPKHFRPTKHEAEDACTASTRISARMRHMPEKRPIYERAAIAVCDEVLEAYLNDREAHVSRGRYARALDLARSY